MSETFHWVLRMRLQREDFAYFEEIDGDFMWTTPCRQDAKAYFDLDEARRALLGLRDRFGGQPWDVTRELRVVRVTVRR